MEAPSFWPNIEEPPHDTTDDEWSFEEVKIFEKALEEFGLDSPGLFERIAARLPRKTETQVRNRWEMLLTEIEMIESGFIPIPHYTAAETTSTTTKSVPPVPVPVPVLVPVIDKKPKRTRGVPWTQQEHEYVSQTSMFLYFILYLCYILSVLFIDHLNFIFLT